MMNMIVIIFGYAEYHDHDDEHDAHCDIRLVICLSNAVPVERISIGIMSLCYERDEACFVICNACE